VLDDLETCLLRFCKLSRMQIKAGHLISRPKALFRKLEDDDKNRLRLKHEGLGRGHGKKVQEEKKPHEDHKAPLQSKHCIDHKKIPSHKDKPHNHDPGLHNKDAHHKDAAGHHKDTGVHEKDAAGHHKDTGVHDKDAAGHHKGAHHRKSEKKQIRLDLRVAKVMESSVHPAADKLLLLLVDVGDEIRQIVAGLKEHYHPKDLIGKKVLVICNLKKAVLRGEESNGMLLAADDGRDVVVLQARDSNPGDHAFFGDRPDQADKPEEINFDDFKTISICVKNKRALCDGKILRTAKEEILADIVDGSKVR